MKAIRELTEDILYRLQRSDDEELVDSVKRMSWWADAISLGETELIRQIVDEGWGMEVERHSGLYFVRLWTEDQRYDSCKGDDPDLRHALIKAYIDWREELRLV